MEAHPFGELQPEPRQGTLSKFAQAARDFFERGEAAEIRVGAGCACCIGYNDTIIFVRLIQEIEVEIAALEERIQENADTEEGSRLIWRVEMVLTPKLDKLKHRYRAHLERVERIRRMVEEATAPIAIV